MRIALRTSGGRGEYELAGRQATINNSDLFGRNLWFQLAPDLTIDGRSAAQLTQGKPRIRLGDPKMDRHAYRVIADVLLLPRPRRELRLTTSDEDFVRDKAYAVSDVDVDVVAVSPTGAILRPTRLYLRNALGLIRRVEVAERMALIHAIWAGVRGEAGVLAALILRHETAARTGDHTDIEQAASAIRGYFGTERDVVGELAAQYGAAAEGTGVKPGDEVPQAGLEDETDPDDARRREVAKWRKQATRTAAGRRFAREVRALYSDRCAVSGTRLPKLDATLSPGVDAAHILPWAKYDLNAVSNGICLNKLCHWGFDAGVLRLDFNVSADCYLVSIPASVTAQAAAVGVELEYFKQYVGPIPDEYLPKDPALRPSPQYLERLNAEMYG